MAGQSTGLPLLASAVPMLAYCSLLLLIATIDLEHHLVPNVLILAGLILAVVFDLLSPLAGSLLQNAASRHPLGEGVQRLTTAVTGAGGSSCR
jgi:Flp pilus assembly protein protease CpaA